MHEKINQRTGRFKLNNGREVFGTLFIRGENTSIILVDDTEFCDDPEKYTFIKGELYNGELASLFQCTLQRVESCGPLSNGRKYSAILFPHFVCIGYNYLSESEPCVSQLNFIMRDAPAVFYDFGAFSTVYNPKPFIPLLKNDAARIREVEFGSNPRIAYFTGKYDILVIDTLLGKVRVHHRPTFTFGGPQGIRIDNEVAVTLTPHDTMIFTEGIRRLLTLIRFFDLIIGREQYLTHLSVYSPNSEEGSQPVNIHRSFSKDLVGVDDISEVRKPGPRDALISIIDGKEQVSNILNNYIKFDSERHDSRRRLQYALNNGQQYTIDRIIGAANIFDILPKSCFPEKIDLSEDLLKAKSESRKLFKSLPNSTERSSILGALGRIGEFSLKHKIRHRVESTGLDKCFPKLIDVLDEAVNCRNHYVHGSPGRIDYSSNFDIVCFFTDCLEFSFAASDLIDAGWDLSVWRKNIPGHSHPFGMLNANYKAQINYFDEIIGASGRYIENN